MSGWVPDSKTQNSLCYPEGKCTQFLPGFQRFALGKDEGRGVMFPGEDPNLVMSPKAEETVRTLVRTSAMRDNKVPLCGVLACCALARQSASNPYLICGMGSATLRVEFTVFISLVRKLWSRAG